MEQGNAAHIALAVAAAEAEHTAALSAVTAAEAELLNIALTTPTGSPAAAQRLTGDLLAGAAKVAELAAKATAAQARVDALTDLSGAFNAAFE